VITIRCHCPAGRSRVANTSFQAAVLAEKLRQQLRAPAVLLEVPLAQRRDMLSDTSRRSGRRVRSASRKACAACSPAIVAASRIATSAPFTSSYRWAGTLLSRLRTSCTRSAAGDSTVWPPPLRREGRRPIVVIVSGRAAPSHQIRKKTRHAS